MASPIWILSDLGEPASTNHRLNYVAVNLLYWFLPKLAWTGVEYLYGLRKLRCGERGTANRIHFAVRFNIID